MTRLTTGLQPVLHTIRRHARRSIAAACASTVALAAALSLLSCGERTPEAPPPPRPVKYVTAPPPHSGNTLLRVGEIHAHDEVALGFRLSGRMISRPVNVGDRVQAGDILATLESHTAENQLLSARADVDSARAAEQVAALNLRRMKLLMRSGALSQSQMDSAQADWQAAASTRKSREASLKIAEENLGWARLIAPADGVITAVNASAGQVVSAGERIATLAAGDLRDAVFNVTTPDDMAHHQQAPFIISLLADPSVNARGTLRDVSPQADPDTRTWRVRVTLTSPPAALALGASVQAAFARDGQAVMALPASSLTRAAGRPAVFVLDARNRRLQLTPVTLAGFSPEQIFITAGVQPGDKVVSAGVSKLRAGERVALGEKTP